MGTCGRGRLLAGRPGPFRLLREVGMSLGIQPAKADVDATAGDIARRLNLAFDLIADFKFWLDAKTVGDLEALGYTTGEANTLKSAYADLEQLRTLYAGAATLGSAKDFRTFAKLLWGFGF